MFITCLKIFISRIVDVSIGTIRTIFVVKGNKVIASILAFIEVLIWFYAAREALVSYNNNLYVAIFYSLGYATGTYLGTNINELLIDGVYNITLISMKITLDDILKIKEEGYGLTVIETVDHKYMLYITVNKKRYKECLKYLKKIDKNSFIVVNDAKISFNGFCSK